jgi:hypothetical protein
MIESKIKICTISRSLDVTCVHPLAPSRHGDELLAFCSSLQQQRRNEAAEHESPAATEVRERWRARALNGATYIEQHWLWQMPTLTVRDGRVVERIDIAAATMPDDSFRLLSAEVRVIVCYYCDV